MNFLREMEGIAKLVLWMDGGQISATSRFRKRTFVITDKKEGKKGIVDFLQLYPFSKLLSERGTIEGF